MRHWLVRAKPALWRRARLLPHRAALARSIARHAAELRAGRAASDGRPTVAIGLHGVIGDLVACEPVVAEVRRRHPDARLLYLTRPAFLDLVRFHPLIDAARPVHCLTEWIALADPAAGLFDHVVDLHVHGQRCKVCNRPIRKTGDAVAIDASRYLAYGPLLTSFALSAGLGPLDAPPRLHLPERAWPTVDAVTPAGPFAVLHGRSSSPQKDWTAAGWSGVVRALHDRGVATIEVGDRPVIEHAVGDRHVDLCGRLSILETAELVRRADLFVGIDSGPAHIANAAGTPGVVLLGRFLGFDRYTPFTGRYADGTGATLVRADEGAEVATIPAEAVIDAAASRLA